MIKLMVKDVYIIKVEIFTKVNLPKEFMMDLVNIFITMEVYMKDYGKMVEEFQMES